MNEWQPTSSFKQAVAPDEKLEIEPSILAWFKARGAGWQEELNGVLEFYIHTVEHPASAPEPGSPDGPR
jgi:uncharacterized protein (DUF4415 family)